MSRRIPAVAVFGHFLSGRHPVEREGVHPMGQDEQIEHR